MSARPLGADCASASVPGCTSAAIRDLPVEAELAARKLGHAIDASDESTMAGQSRRRAHLD